MAVDARPQARSHRHHREGGPHERSRNTRRQGVLPVQGQVQLYLRINPQSLSWTERPLQDPEPAQDDSERVPLLVRQLHHLLRSVPQLRQARRQPLPDPLPDGPRRVPLLHRNHLPPGPSRSSLHHLNADARRRNVLHRGRLPHQG
uniref:(northern house mosquito) hypothetical protein n=1 Tax=Culex pipiens TaxID=7175 RepID=A0A8D8JJS8_CULPI